jgi:hypothetical protein
MGRCHLSPSTLDLDKVMAEILDEEQEFLADDLAGKMPVPFTPRRSTSDF